MKCFIYYLNPDYALAFVIKVTNTIKTAVCAEFLCYNFVRSFALAPIKIEGLF